MRLSSKIKIVKTAFFKIKHLPPIWQFILPFVVFMLFTALAPYTGEMSHWVYCIKTLVVSLILYLCWPSGEWRGEWKCVESVIVGLLVLVLWIFLDPFYPHLSESKPFVPELQSMGSILFYTWLSIRILGSSLMVPLMEELFWKSFLVRWVINPDFQKVAHGAMTIQAFAVSTLLFGLEHNRWLSGIVAGMLYNLLWYRSKGIKACVLAHAVTNLGLSIYVIYSGEWTFWS